MKRFLLGICLACLSIGTTGCCCWEGSGWSPCAWPGCGWGKSCGGCGDSCGGCDTCGGWGGWNGWGCGNKGGCGEVYWGDWCTGNPHCSTCDGCGNWVGPPSPGGNGLPPESYSRAHPYGNQVVRSSKPMRVSPSAAPETMMARRAPPSDYKPQLTHRPGTRQYYSKRPQGPQFGPQGQQYAQRGPKQEYEGAIEYLGTTDRLVRPATLPGSSASSSSVARRGEPTLAEPEAEFTAERPQPQVRRTSSQRTYTR